METTTTLKVAVRKDNYAVLVTCNAWRASTSITLSAVEYQCKKEIQSREMSNQRTRHEKRLTQSNGQKAWKKLIAWWMRCGLW